MKYDFNEVIERRNTQSMKWGKTDLLPFWVADMDFACPPAIIDALKQRTQKRIFGYTLLKEEYYHMVKGWYKRKYDWDVDEKNIFYSPGVMASISFLIQGLTNEKDGVIIQPPVYPMFQKTIHAHKRKVIENHLLFTKDGYQIDFDDLEKQLKQPENKVLLFCSPHNPVGRVWKENELKQLVLLCEKYGVYIITDEIHGDIIRKNKRFLPLSKIKSSEYVITCNAPSKTFNIPGLMFSNVVIEDKKIKTIWKRQAYSKSGLSLPNPFGYSATQAAYTQCDDWLDDLNDYIEYNLMILHQQLKNAFPQISYELPEGTYLAWVDLSSLGYDDDELEERLLKKGKVWLSRGRDFSAKTRTHRRINVACPRSVLEEGIERIISCLSLNG